ncbi:MAG: nucleotidyltransferase substrate binding protein [Deltaproteobacteria bacterium]|nr:nucleotidyltransferase substrate binding protein [Deltaproteobacteria bacterium]
MEQLIQATTKLSEALSEDPKDNELFIDGSIQRFEFCFELCWKTIKRFLENEGLLPKTPRDVFKEAFKLGWLREGDEFWSDMIDDRNSTVHTYNKTLAQELYLRLPAYLKSFQKLAEFLRKK